MKAIDIEIGAWVRDHEKHPVRKGTVIGTKLSDGDETVAVEWSDGCLTKENINDLTLVDSKLEQDYEKIKELIVVASKALGEANLLARENHTSLSSLEYHDDDLSLHDLMQALDAAGWSTSSMSC